MYGVRTHPRRLPTLAERYSARQNAFGVLRLLLAGGVIVAHSWPLGFGLPSPGHAFSSGQSDLSTLSVYGFFFIAGFLITESGLRSSLRQYLWARFLRIFPGLWVCLLVTAFGLAPLVALYERGSLDGFWSHPEGPFDYLTTNWLASMEQFPISGLLAETPFGQVVGGPSAFAGSLWTLRYDLAFYAVIAVLLGTGLLRRTPRAVLLLAVGCYLLLLRDVLAAPTWTARPPAHGAVGPIPLIGSFAADWMLQLGFLFLLGAVARLYAHRIPLHGAMAAVAATLVVATLWRGGFFALGLPAYGYLVLYLAVALPRRLAWLGQGRDYTYGVYIYGFPVQQVLALLGAQRFGLAGYILLSLLGALLFAIPSWHLVEGPASRWKRRGPGATYRRRHGVGDRPEPPAPQPRPVPDTGARTAAVQVAAVQAAPVQHGAAQAVAAEAGAAQIGAAPAGVGRVAGERTDRGSRPGSRPPARHRRPARPAGALLARYLRRRTPALTAGPTHRAVRAAGERPEADTVTDGAR
ncbi:acyltransferase family protein [Plantactinospora endophytica]|uniref:Acyltransferase 3 domain-containing protein n=1 Tax=Plantactinospora endophytica TaxID=673535 RepID=A0ABQ4E1M5_9ACTN|nr:acyltransferase [Plantactinospora endophytica]GIG88201.1 hypothetical protein Pen02_31370 [Plantactinospora endophytica]